MSAAHNISLLWLRRDLRLHDHAALAAALAEKGQVQPVFVFDTDVLARFADPQDRRLSFIAEALCAMDAELRERGGGLLVLHGAAREVMPKLASALSANIFTAEDYEPETRARDAAVGTACELLTVVKDQLIFDPREVLKGDGTPFKVFTPYSRAWFALATPDAFGEYVIKDQGRYADAGDTRKRTEAAGLRVITAKNPAEMLDAVGYKYKQDELWPPGEARARLKRFMQKKISGYERGRDFPAEEGTSRISPYLRFGLVTPREAFRLAEGHADTRKWLTELVWREFYAMILYHWPESARTEWNAEYREKLDWSHSTELFDAWREGMTGYPFIDAAMRELKTTGWMHNRARMIVASFLTKDLRIDWRKGEEHFAQYLMDYDLASNVGGWQWAASTGTDAQPYFRVFNPLLQSQKFDPEGEYIRRFVPELAHLDAKTIHAPHGLEKPTSYPLPIVDHDKARGEAIEMFRRARIA